ncbi:sensor histidine kinase [Micromonosporaceae bacterium Da 78-11]
MRRLLGVLRSADDTAARAPQPGLAEIGDLVETARAAGVEVTGELPDLGRAPATVGLTAYRIVQEALANAARHAPGGPVRIEGRVLADRFELTVRNRLTGPVSDADGHGLVGMRERAVLLGGTLTAGPDGEDFLVDAVLPVTGES